MTTQELIDYYKGLLILQYASQGNAVNTIDLIASAIVQDQIISKVRDGFDVDTAIGAQLDILGQWRGVKRTLFGTVPADDWSLMEYADADDTFDGWMEYADADASVVALWLEYVDVDGLPYDLSDTQYRKLIKFAADLSGWDGTLKGIDDILYKWFTTYVTISDNINMTITYTHNSADPDPDTLWDFALLANIVPHPSGVDVSYVEV